VKVTQVGNTSTVKPNKPVSSSIRVVRYPSRHTSWRDDGWHDFSGKCEMEFATIEIWENTTGLRLMMHETHTLGELAKIMKSKRCFLTSQDSLVPYRFNDMLNDDRERTTRKINLRYCVKIKYNKNTSSSSSFGSWYFAVMLCMGLSFAAIVVCGITISNNADEYNRHHNHPQRILEVAPHRPRLTQRRPVQPPPPAPSPPTQAKNIKQQHSALTLECLVHLDGSTISTKTISAASDGDNSKRGGQGQYDNFTCAICLSDLQMCDQVKKLRCQHVFHADCVDLWGETANTCPLCKMDFSQRRQQQTSGHSAMERPGNSDEETHRGNRSIETSGGCGALSFLSSSTTRRNQPYF
jgi:hypothetical protein